MPPNTSPAASDGPDSTQQAILEELTRLFEPLDYLTDEIPASGKSRRTRLLLVEAGYTERQTRNIVDPAMDVLNGVRSSYRAVEELIRIIQEGNLSEIDPGRFEGYASDIRTLFSQIRKLNDVARSIDAGKVGDRLIDYLIARYFERYHRSVYATLRLVAVIEERENEPTELHFENLGKLFTEPNQAIVKRLGWTKGDDTSFQFEFFAEILVAYFETTDFAMTPTPVSTPATAKGRPRVEPAGVVTPILVNNPKGGGAAYDVGLYWLPLTEPSGDDVAGFALVPYGELRFTESLQLGKGWSLAFDASVKENDFMLFADPAGTEVHVPSDRRALPEGNVSASLENVTRSEAGTVVLGRRDGTNITYDRMALETGIEVANEQTSASIESMVDGTIAIKPRGGLLKEVLPSDGITGDFETTVGWANTKGLYFDGAAKLATRIPINETIGKKGAKLELVEVYLALEVGGDDAIEVTGAVTASAQLGPMSGTVKRMGITGDVSFPANRDGNLGVVDFELEFDPPTGVGLSMDQPGISGGGFLEYDPENERYAAVISITIGPVQVSVFGLLATEMPDGSEGFSLLISVFGEFPPVQLSFGFTLNGLGGVLGLHRAMQPKPLRRAVRTGAIDNLLFPDDPAAHAAQLISDLRSIYPVTRNQHVFGPMARLGWGTPAMIHFDMGFILQLPRFKIALIGAVTYGLPSIEMPKRAQMIRVNIAITGTINPERKLLAVDGGLFDSRVMQYALDGSMAMQVRWTRTPEFMFSIGGFNDRYQPPDDFPSLDDVTISLSIPGGQPSVQWTGYFALTPNTVQAGASFVARFEAGPAKAKGGWRIDTLFQFRPFQFVAKFEAGLDVRVKGFSVSVTLHGKIKGPSPVHVRGKLNIDLPGPVPDPSPKVHITLGDKKQKDDAMPTANVLEELSEAVAKPGNWSAQLPENGRDLVTLRDIETDDSTVLAHPMGRLSVRQTVVPLNEPIEKYGQNRPIHETFDIEVASDGSSDSDGGDDSTSDADELPAMSDLQESFAPSKFERMSDSERMNAPSFRKMNAGREVKGNLFHWGCWAPEDEETETPDNAASAELLYESSREGPFPEEGLPGDPDSDSTSTDGGTAEAADHRPAYPHRVARALSDDGSVANAEHRRTGERKFVPDGSQVDRVAFRSNYGRLLAPIAVLADPTVLDERPDTGSVTAATGGWSG